MNRKFLSPAVLLVTMIAWGVTAPVSNGRSPQCLGGKRAALVQGHFTGAIVCSRKNASFVLVGRTKGRRFEIYDYRYRFLPTGGTVMHGGQKIVVFRENFYVGQYALSPPPYVTVTVSGSYVALQAPGAPKVQMNFTREPPSQVLFYGEAQTFSQ